MIVKKRDGTFQEFNTKKIVAAIDAAAADIGKEIPNIAYRIAKEVRAENQDKDVLTIEEIQNLVENKLMGSREKDVARAYVRYRYERELIRNAQGSDRTILELLEGTNDYWNNENSNKNAAIASTQRDYMAGIVSKDISERLLLPKDVVEAHKNGEIHFHDMDYFAQRIFNCDVYNLEDMLQNGTVINKTLIEKPHSFSTACNIATQIMACIASGQYGGQTISLAHIAPFIDISRQKIKKDVEEEFASIHLDGIYDLFEEIVEKRLREEIKRGVQTMQYQINTLNTSNG